jgi:hypothetical protein
MDYDDPNLAAVSLSPSMTLHGRRNQKAPPEMVDSDPPELAPVADDEEEGNEGAHTIRNPRRHSSPHVRAGRRSHRGYRHQAANGDVNFVSTVSFEDGDYVIYGVSDNREAMIPVEEIVGIEVNLKNPKQAWFNDAKTLPAIIAKLRKEIEKAGAK